MGSTSHPLRIFSALAVLPIVITTERGPGSANVRTATTEHLLILPLSPAQVSALTHVHAAYSFIRHHLVQHHTANKKISVADRLLICVDISADALLISAAFPN